MGLLGFIEKAINTVATTVKEVVAPSSTPKNITKEPIQMVSKETLDKQKNEDSVEISKKTAASAYKQIEELCADYRMSLEDAKKVGLLEKISGCSTEELAQKSDAEIKEYIDALKFVLRWQSWKFPWQKRDAEDIASIAEKANKRYAYTLSGESWLSELFRGKSDLKEELSKSGLNEINEENIQKYFQNKIRTAELSGDREKIEKAYSEAEEIFNNLIRDTENPIHKEYLTAAISELRSANRMNAVKLSMATCGNNKISQQHVARGISKHYEQITCNKDAFGEYTSNEDNVAIAQISFAHMTEADVMATLDTMRARRAEIQAKIANGEPLTEAEARYYNSVQTSQYAGALTGSVCNTDLSNPNTVIGVIDTDTKAFGIQEEVYKTAANYVNAHSEELQITPEEFTQKVDKATNNNYSKVINNTETTTPNTAVTQNKSEETNIKENGDVVSTESKATTTLSAVVKPEKGINTKPASEKEEQSLQTKPKEAEKTITYKEALKGDVKTKKQYARDNHINTFKLAIDSLNSTHLNGSSKDWALGEFERASSALQKLNFTKISNGSNAIAAARVMDKNTRSELTTFRCYAIKQSVEKLNQELSD